MPSRLLASAFAQLPASALSEATRTGFSALVRTDSVRSFCVFLEIAGAVFAVITWTTSLVASSLRLSPPKLAGAKPWARAPALNVTETNAVASARKSGRLRTRARYAGNHKPWQAFFFDKNRCRLVGYRAMVSVCRGIRRPSPFQSPGKSGGNPGGGPNIWPRSMFARFR